VQDPNAQTLQAARQAWSVARITWEESEAFAFGPAAYLGLDADLDEWPLNEVEVLEVLNSGDPLTPETVAELESGQKGFHAVAFLLFGVDNNKSLQDFTERDREYLAALGPVLADTAAKLLKSWTEGVQGQQWLLTHGEHLPKLRQICPEIERSSHLQELSHAASCC
jgi:uncharacterized iron-regulated protein